MEKISDAKEFLTKGEAYFNNEHFVEAIKCFEMASTDGDFITRSNAIVNLAKVNSKIGRLDLAREILNKSIIKNSSILNLMFGALEISDYNFSASMEYYQTVMQFDQFRQYNTLFGLADVYTQTGEYDMARKIYETFLFNERFRLKSIFEIVCLCILEGDYKYAYKLLQDIDVSKLDYKGSSNYFTLLAYLKVLMGTFSKSDIPDKHKDIYRLNLLMADDDQLLLDHITKHLYQGDSLESSFFKYTDLKKILAEVREQLIKYNPVRDSFCDIYTVHLDSPVGFNGEIITSDVKVVTYLNSDCIITMYPVILSSEFNKEGFATSQELKVKRMGGNNGK